MTDPTSASPSIKISTGGVKKGRNEGKKIITANRFSDGIVVYHLNDTHWTENISKATIYEGTSAMTALQRTAAQEALIVGPYLMDIDTTQRNEIIPDGRGRLREEIRRLGPTNRTDHGKQAWGVGA